MRRSLLWWMVGLGWSMAVVPGCGPDLPARGRASSPEPEPVRTLFLIAPGPPDTEAAGWALVGLREANGERVIFRALGPANDAASVDGPGMVRRAIADGASALIVASTVAPGLPEALAEAEAKKIPVVVIGPPIAAPAGSPPFTSVAPMPFDATADELVRSALEDLKQKAGRPAEGTAVVLAGRGVDAFGPDRVAALGAAATRAGLKVRTIDFAPPSNPATVDSTVKAIREIPDVAILLGADDPALSLAIEVRRELAPGVKVFASGYSSRQNSLLPIVFGSESGLVDYRSEDLGRLAVQAALGRLRGEPAGRKVELGLRFRRGLGEETPVVTEQPAIQRGKEMPSGGPARKRQ